MIKHNVTQMLHVLLQKMQEHDQQQTQAVPLCSIQPSRVAVRFDRTNDCMYVMRLEGLDKSPLFNN